MFCCSKPIEYEVLINGWPITYCILSVGVSRKKRRNLSWRVVPLNATQPNETGNMHRRASRMAESEKMKTNVSRSLRMHDPNTAFMNLFEGPTGERVLRTHQRQAIHIKGNDWWMCAPVWVHAANTFLM